MQVASSPSVIISEEAGGVPKSIAEALWRVSQNPYMPKANYDGDGKSNSDGGNQGQTNVQYPDNVISSDTSWSFPVGEGTFKTGVIYMKYGTVKQKLSNDSDTSVDVTRRVWNPI